MGALAQHDVQQDVGGGVLEAGSTATVRSGPSGRPMSVEETTSPASPPSACPTCWPNIAPPACDSIPNSGPAIALASSGSASPMALTTCAAMGSTSFCHVPAVASIHSARLHAVEVVAPAGIEVAPSSHSSASRVASSTAPCWAELGLGSGPAAASVWRATSLASSKLTLPSCGANIFCIWPMIWFIST
jgi:hypothetical protein